MIKAPNILLLAEGATGYELSARLGGSVTSHSDPYQALETLSESPFQAVVFTAPRPELASLCRAMRRIREDVKLLALTSVRGESQVQALRGLELDDYFIYPPTREDIAAIVKYAGASQEKEVRQGAPARVQEVSTERSLLLEPAQASKLMESAVSTSALEAALAELVAKRLLASVRWIDAKALDKGQPSLLMVTGETGRALVAQKPGQYKPDQEQFLASLNELLTGLFVSARRTEALHRLAITDHLTGSYNRRHFYHMADHILQQARVNKFRVTLLLYDIDNFKHYNETYGHAAGDDILRQTAQLMKRTCRSHDIVARIGGDEFAALFWDVQPPRRAASRPLDDFYLLAERFRKAVNSHSFQSLGPEAQGVLTISGGLANFPDDGQTCRDLLRSADLALRQTKTAGKDGIWLVGR